MTPSSAARVTPAAPTAASSQPVDSITPAPSEPLRPSRARPGAEPAERHGDAYPIHDEKLIDPF